MKNFIYIFILLNFRLLLSQQSSFTIQGYLENSKCDSIYFSQIVQNSEYYAESNQKYDIKNGILNIKGKVSYPQAFGVYSNCDGYYGIYILRKGNHNYIFKKKNNRESFPQADDEFASILKNYSEEEKLIYREFDEFKKNNLLTPEKKISYYNQLNTNTIKKDSLIYRYAQKNKDPFLVLWYLIYSTENTTHYSTWYKKAFEVFPDNVKNILAGKKLADKINLLEKIQPGNKFPMEIVNKNFDFQKDNKRYILLDFWFSHCGPCLHEFPKYKAVYEKYKDKHLEIIGISTDRSKDIENWKKVIKEKELPWKHFLDENGTESKKYNINAFPTTFLLDTERTIIKKNISPEELEVFLEQNL